MLHALDRSWPLALALTVAAILPGSAIGRRGSAKTTRTADTSVNSHHLAVDTAVDRDQCTGRAARTSTTGTAVSASGTVAPRATQVGFITAWLAAVTSEASKLTSAAITAVSPGPTSTA